MDERNKEVEAKLINSIREGNRDDVCSLATFYYDIGEYNKAIKVFRKYKSNLTDKERVCKSIGYFQKNKFKKAYDLCIVAANNGDPLGKYYVGTYYEFNPNKNLRDDNMAFEWYLRSAESGYSEAQVKVGEMYECGQGVEKDESKAFEYYQKAAEKEDVEAYYHLALLYNKPAYLDKNKYLDYLRKAAEKGKAGAQYLIGEEAFQNQNYEEAMRWYDEAARQGEERALFSFGVESLKGDKLPKDLTKARQCFEVSETIRGRLCYAALCLLEDTPYFDLPSAAASLTMAKLENDCLKEFPNMKEFFMGEETNHDFDFESVLEQYLNKIGEYFKGENPLELAM